MIPGTCATLRGRLAVMGTAYTALLMVLVAFDLDAGAVEHDPALLLLPLALLAEAGYVGWIVGRSAVSHRGAGVVDRVTGLLNRTALRARLLELDAQTASVPHRVSMLLIDVDRFKQINDRVGHAAGDVVLRDVGARIRATLRTYRVGLPRRRRGGAGADPECGHRLAPEVGERLRQAVRAEPCGGLEVTVSVGVGVTAPGERFVFDEVFGRADAALYEAKRTGRDCVCVRDSSDDAHGREGLSGRAPDSLSSLTSRPRI